MPNWIKRCYLANFTKTSHAKLSDKLVDSRAELLNGWITRLVRIVVIPVDDEFAKDGFQTRCYSKILCGCLIVRRGLQQSQGGSFFCCIF